MGSNEEIRRLAQEAEKQQLFAQKVQQQNTTLTSQLELYKERVRNLKAQFKYVRDRDIIPDLGKTTRYFRSVRCLSAKIKDLENVVCKMGKSTETLRLLTNEQKVFRDNLHKSGLGYNGPYVLSQAYAKIPKLYRAYELCDKNKQLHVFDSEETLENAEKIQLKHDEFKKMKSSRS
ncbi:hypothetical protein Tco_0092093 [Tanacetum coccineum]